MKVFQVDDVTWYVGETAEAARNAYKADAGDRFDCDLSEEFGPPEEVIEPELSRLLVTDLDESGQPKHTFKELLDVLNERGETRARFFCYAAGGRVSA